MSLLPHRLYRVADVRALDRIAIEAYSIPGMTLMARAGTAAFTVLGERWPDAQRIAVVCGDGNNGGDGFVVARLAHEAGLEVTVVLLAAVDSLKGDARLACQSMVAAGVEPNMMVPGLLNGVDLIVDALLGTGLARPVDGAMRSAIAEINTAPAPVLAIDIPSGLNGDRGVEMGMAVSATVTITFIGVTQGMLTAAGPDYCGEILFDDLQLPATLFEHVAPTAARIECDQFSTLLPPRARSTHKGDCGHVLVVGGAPGMSGAARISGEAALRCGAGLVSIATAAADVATMNHTRPELMVHVVGDANELHPLVKQADVIAIGPGLGQSAWGMTLLAAALAYDAPLVVDADGLNLLAADPCMRDDWILTPHPGEAARLLNCSTREVQADRFSAIDALQRKYGGVVVLKGSGSLVIDQDGAVSLCDAGNPGMASGGMGDLLTGVIAALIAQGLSLADAARFGVSLHASAADHAAMCGERGMLASDLLPHLRKLVNGL